MLEILMSLELNKLISAWRDMMKLMTSWQIREISNNWLQVLTELLI